MRIREAQRYGTQVELVQHLRADPGANDPLVVLTGQHLIYFLADRPSAIEESEFALYLIGFGLLRDTDARRLIDQGRIIERLGTIRPTLVEDSAHDRRNHFRRALPDLARWVDMHYRLTRRIGSFRVLDWSD